MTNFLIIFGFLNVILILESMADAFVYKAWTIPQNKKYGNLQHILQLVLFLVIFVFGFWFGYKLSCAYNNNSLAYVLELYYIPQNLTYTLMVYIMFRLSIFNKLYSYFSGEHSAGTTDLWDVFCNFILLQIKKTNYFKPIIFIFLILRIALYVFGIIILYLRFK